MLWKKTNVSIVRKHGRFIYRVKKVEMYKGLVPPRDHGFFLDENHFWGTKFNFFLGQYF